MTRATPKLHEHRGKRAAYQVRIDLQGADPAIWRRLELPSDLPLSDLHVAIQIAMGWEGLHLHSFSLGTGHHALRFTTLDPEGNRLDIPGTRPADTDIRLDEVLHDVGDELGYDYDGWQHRLQLEEVLERAADDQTVRLLAGERACPPEDCGGTRAYAMYAEVATALEAGETVRANDVEAFEQWWPDMTPGHVLDLMATFDTESAAATLARWSANLIAPQDDAPPST